MKAFKYHDIYISQEDADYAESIGLTKMAIQHRIDRRKLSIHDLTHKPPHGGGRPKSEVKQEKPKSSGKHGNFISSREVSMKGVKVYHLPLEKIWEKYGKPGEIKYPERQKKYAGTHWGD